MESKVRVTRRAAAASASDVVLEFLFEGESIRGRGGDEAGAIAAEAKRRRFAGTAGTCLDVDHGSGAARTTTILVGLGKKSAVTPEILRDATAAGVRASRARRPRIVSLVMPLVPGLDDAAIAIALARGACGGSYAFDRYISERERRPHQPNEFRLIAGERAAAAQRGVLVSDAIVEGATIARDLVNTPPSDLDPSAFERAVRRIARDAGLRLRVLAERELVRARMNAMLAVGRAGSTPPRLLHLVHKPPGRARRRVALVGKGITFDSGGYNLKPTGSIEDMKSDMAGAAATLGAAVAASRLDLGVEVHAFLAVAENLVSSRALKPGDVLRTRSGRTVEINNTDAEGRLVLADAIDYARTVAKPEAIVDLATLTGSCVVALGPRAAGLMSNDDELAGELAKAAARAGERVWRLPLYPDYFEQLESDVADFKNTGERWGGALTAGLFLERFAAGTPWAHLDIAGPAWLDKEHPHWGKGGTGFGVATITEWLMSKVAR